MSVNVPQNYYGFPTPYSKLTIEPGITSFVVGPKGNFKKIQAALNAIGPNGSAFIYIQPGTYTENLVFPNGINVTLRSGGDDNCGDVKIIGMHIPPATGNVLFWMIGLRSSSHIFNSSVAGSAAILIAHNIQNCNGYIFNLPNWTGSFVFFATSDFGATADGIINNSGGATVFLLESSLGVGNTFPMNLSGFTVIEVNNINCPIVTNGATVNFYDSNFFFPITFGGDTTGFLVNSLIQTGASVGITYNSSGQTLLSNVVIDTSNNPAISGTSSGNLKIGSVTFTQNGNIANTVTLNTSSALFTGEVRAAGDVSGIAGATTLTSTNSTTISTGVGSVKMSSANPGTNAAWLKFYVGTTPYWVPAWTTNSP